MTTKTLTLKGLWRRIKKVFNLTYFIYLLVWTIICLLFSKPINNLANFTGNTLFQYDKSILYDVLAFILLVSFVIIREIKISKTVFKDWILLFYIGFLIWYIPARFWVEPKISFISFSFCNQLKLIDLLGIAFVFEIFQIRREGKKLLKDLKDLKQTFHNRKEQAKQSSFITDEAYMPRYKTPADLLGFNSFAERITNEIKTVSSKESVVFGINGEWGEGKTSMINLIRKQLNRDDYMVVDFHPWKTNSGKAMNQLFFDALKDGLKDKIWGINWKIDRYADALLQLDKTGLSKTIWQIFFQTDSVEKQKERLAESMKLLDKNLVVVVDDLDRLAKNEIADVLKLMRDTANFPNLVFLAAYDRMYLNMAIKEEINEYNYENYMDKIVLWEAPIYRPQPRKYLYELKKLLKYKLPESEKYIDEIFDEDKSFLSKTTLDYVKNKNNPDHSKHPHINIETPDEIHTAIFTNLRMVKRFCNYLIFNIQFVQDKVVFSDFYYLYLLRFLYPTSFERFIIAYHELHRVKNVKNDKIETDIGKYKELVFTEEDKKEEDKTISIITAILSNIIDSSLQVSSNSLVYYKNFLNYFHLGNHNDVTMAEFSAMLKAENFEAIKIRIDQVSQMGNILNLFTDSSVIKALQENFQFEKGTSAYIDYFKSMIWMSIKYDRWEFYMECHSRMQQICLNKDYKIDSKQVQSKLIDFVSKENIQNEVQYYFYFVIRNAFDSNTYALNESYFGIETAIKYSRENFDKRIKNTNSITPEIIQLFYCSYRRIDAKKYPQTCNKMHDLVNQYPDDFVKIILVLYSTIPVMAEPEAVYDYQFVDFLVDIFKSPSGFIEFLKTSQFKRESKRANLYSKYAEKLKSKNPKGPIRGILTPTRNEYINLLTGLDSLDVLLNWKLKARIDEELRKIW